MRTPIARPLPFVSVRFVALVLLVAVSGSGGCDREQTAAGTPAAAAGAPPSADAGATPGGVAAVVQNVGLVTEGYVDDDACTACHREAVESFQQSGMSRTLVPATPENIFEDWQKDYYHEASKRHYEMRERDGGFYITRYQKTPDGARFNVLERRVEYVIGSGAHSRTYLYTNEAGEIYQFPIAWHAELGDFAMHNGFTQANHRGFGRRVQRQCIGCHTAYTDVPDGSDVFGHPHVFPHPLPHGIGCQRCHGGGAEHIRLAHDMDVSNEAVRAAIVNPPELTGQTHEDLCLQCHMEPASRIPSVSTRFGEGWFAFQPGDSLADQRFYANFGDETMQRQRFEANHHGYRMRMSKCYTESAGAFTCTTCHNPHDRPAPERRIEYYREKCYGCHAIDECDLESMQAAGASMPFVADVAADDCASCHMPLRRAHDLVHELNTDHWIRREPPSEDLLAPRSEEPPLIAPASDYWPERGLDPVQRALHVALIDLQLGANPANTERFARALEEAKPTAARPYFYLASAYQRQGRSAEALELFRTAAGYGPDLPLVQFELGRQLLQRNDLAGAQKQFDRVMAMAPDLPEAYLGKALVAMRQRNAPAATAALEEVIRLRPQDLNAHNQLAGVFMQTRQVERGIEAFDKLLAMEPGSMEAYKQIGLAQIYLGQPERALAMLSRGLVIQPAHAGLMEAMAAALVYAKRYDQALAAASAAARAPSADRANCTMLTGLAQHGLGQPAAKETLMQGLTAARAQPTNSSLRGMLTRSATQILQTP
ncbi:MAG: tetratricopeptide repeat protein [Phycisphaerales bacterium]|nr:tetratricopeptide repeat protein [Phycisphaerae bacterium]NNM27318.1 tetratricopeptide repeat protein [Phycisphaerales bacterium]